MHPKAQSLHPHMKKIYVKVSSETDTTGYVQPVSITWQDGRTFKIDAVKDFRPADTVGLHFPGDCYTVVINGQEKHLFFERTNPKYFPSRTGRWFVEAIAGQDEYDDTADNDNTAGYSGIAGYDSTICQEGRRQA